MGLAMVSASSLADDLLPDSYPENFTAVLEGMQFESAEKFTKTELLKLSTIFMAKAADLKPTCPQYWSNLAFALHRYSFSLEKDSDQFEEAIEDAFIAIKKALSLNRTCHRLWNIFGAIAQNAGKNRLAQHCFIQSLTIQDVLIFWVPGRFDHNKMIGQFIFIDKSFIKFIQSRSF